MKGITLTDGNGKHLTTDKHGLLTWTDDATIAISFADAQSASRFARMTGGLQEIQKHRAVCVFDGADEPARTEAPAPLPTTKPKAKAR